MTCVANRVNPIFAFSREYTHSPMTVHDIDSMILVCILSIIQLVFFIDYKLSRCSAAALNFRVFLSSIVVSPSVARRSHSFTARENTNKEDQHIQETEEERKKKKNSSF